MITTVLRPLGRSLSAAGAATLFAACADSAPLGLAQFGPSKVQAAALPGTDTDGMISTLQRVTAHYHRLSVANEEGFVLLHPCEARGDEGPVGTVYVNIARLMDGVIDPETPDALIYEPTREGAFRLVGVEFAIPKALWPNAEPPKFLGNTFQSEDEFGVYALHVWVWRNNRNGLFAETNPGVSCGA